MRGEGGREQRRAGLAPATAGAAPPPIWGYNRMGRRWTKVLTVIVVVLAGLFVAADRIAVHEADDYVANKAEAGYGLGAATDSYTTVDIHGFPFLTQAVGREFDDVTLTAGNLTAHDGSNPSGGGLAISKAQFDLHDVQISSDFHSARSGQVDGTVTIGWSQLSQALTQQAGGGTVTVAARSTGGGPGTSSAAVDVTGPVDGRTVSGTGKITADSDELHFAVPGTGHAPASWLINLPGNLRFNGIHTTPTALTLSVTGFDVSLGE